MSLPLLLCIHVSHCLYLCAFISCVSPSVPPSSRCQFSTPLYLCSTTVSSLYHFLRFLISLSPSLHASLPPYFTPSSVLFPGSLQLLLFHSVFLFTHTLLPCVTPSLLLSRCISYLCSFLSLFPSVPLSSFSVPLSPPCTSLSIYPSLHPCISLPPSLLYCTSLCVTLSVLLSLCSSPWSQGTRIFA
jgi:hypothetical protein